MTSSQPVRRFDWNNLGIRAASAVVLIPAAVAAVFFGGWVLLLLVSVAVALLALEWGGMSAPGAPIRIAAAVMVAVLAALFVAYYGHYRIAWAIAGVGAVVAAIVGRSLSERAGDAAYGVIYIAPAVLALFWIRAMEDPSLRWPTWTIMVFAVTWAADLFAFATGNVLKGPKLWPRFSPNKTWTGFFGGLAGAMAAAMLVSLFLTTGLSMGAAALVGLAGGLATMAGDLWESMLKRRFGVKDSGDLIPGHGGLLDRVDGLMFAIVVVAAARLMQLEGWLQ